MVDDDTALSPILFHVLSACLQVYLQRHAQVEVEADVYDPRVEVADV